jgi:hypothetical protein
VLKAPWLVAVKEKMAREENRAIYRSRKQTVEPVFGVIKQAMGFRQFLLRGEEKNSGREGVVNAGLQLQATGQLDASAGMKKSSQGKNDHIWGWLEAAERP